VSAYWVTTLQRLVLILIGSAVYFPLMLRLVRRLDRGDARYAVEAVGQDPVANAIYAGARELALVIAGTWVFVEVIKACLL